MKEKKKKVIEGWTNSQWKKCFTKGPVWITFPKIYIGKTTAKMMGNLKKPVKLRITIEEI